MMKRIAGLFRPKSNGVRVSRAALGHIRSGNAARAGGRWSDAADAYRAALAEMPGLAHIWVQYGHASKEAGEHMVAAEAYARAAALRPDDPEPHMYLGHMAKRAGTGGAARHYLDALVRAPEDLSAIGEVMQQLVARRIGDQAMIGEALALLGIDRTTLTPDPEEAELPAGTIFFDVTDLISFFGFSRIPSGVQRVQMEVILAMRGIAAGRRLALCYHSAARRGWSLIPQAAFVSLCSASSRDEPDAVERWARELRLFYVRCALTEDLAFPKKTVLVSLGANMPNPNYLLDVRTTRDRQGVVYVTMIHDLIPSLFPQWVVPEHEQVFRIWLASVFASANGLFANSNRTRADLLAHAARENQPINPDLVRVIRLDGLSIRPEARPLPVELLSTRRLVPGGYVLFVSTIEPRKNHIGALKAWLALAAEIGQRRMPTLVCVGGRGWMNDGVHALIARNRLLRRKVRLLNDVSDEELSLLYRHCAFTLYPSFYEGWGLPITESLSHGKLPAVSATSSMPEVGGDLAVYFDPHDPAAIARALTPLVLDPDRVRRAEARIAAEFRPRSWSEIGAEFADAALAIAASSEPLRPPAAPAIGERCSLALGGSPGMRNGELFRHGRGWAMPDATGCRIDAADALLRFEPPARPAAVRIALAAGDAAVAFRVRGGAREHDGFLAPGERRTVDVPLRHRRSRSVIERIVGHRAPPPSVVSIEIAAGEDTGLSVEGFELRSA